MITPRINAASRMGKALPAFELLSTRDPVCGQERAEVLNHANNERKGIVAAMMKEAKQKIAGRYDGEKKVIVLGNTNWRPSLLGLVCNSLLKEYNCPVFLWGRSAEFLKGSCRAPSDINLLSLMREVPQGILSEFGGHALSGGFTVSPQSVHLLEPSLQEAYKTVADSNKEDGSGLFIDRKISIDDLDGGLFKEIEKLAPFGIGNPKPLFLLEGVFVPRALRFGKSKEHVKFILPTRGKSMEAIEFFASEDRFNIKEGSKANFIVHLEQTYFRGFSENRLRIVDILES